nr:MAG TPA: hypothetical protein [Caudoviricetes sp.]
MDMAYWDKDKCMDLSGARVKYLLYRPGGERVFGKWSRLTQAMHPTHSHFF